MIGVDGTVDARGRSASFDKSFSDLLEDVNFGIMGRGEASYDRFILTSDIVYADLEAKEDVGSSNVRLDVTETILELGGGYQLVDFCFGEGEYPRLTIDALAGARYYDADMTLKGPFGRDPNTNITYWEPYVGPRVTFAYDQEWSTAIRTDVGGFSIGNDPDISWQMSAGVAYQATDLISVGVGYKLYNIYGLDRQDASMDLRQGGIVTEAGFSF